MLINSENYHSVEVNNEYMSVSQFKGFLPQYGGCEAKSMAKLRGEYVEKSKTAFLVGSYVHAFNEDMLEKFIEDHPEITTKGGALRADYIKANNAIEVISRDKLFMTALSGQKEVIVTAELFGIKWRIMIDSFSEKLKRFTDLKYLKSLDDKVWNRELHLYEHVLEAYGYYLQVAIYSKVLSVNRKLDVGDYFEPLLAIVTKEDIPNKAIVGFISDQETLATFIERQLFIVENFIERVKEVKSGKVEPIRCGSCDYCRETKVLMGTTHYSDFSVY